MSRDAVFAPELHRARRQRLLNALGDGVLIVPTAPVTARNGDVDHEFRPGSDFHYLTGFPEPEAVLVASRSDRSRHRSILFVRERDRQRETWDGPRFGTRGAKQRFGVDEARPIGDLWQDLLELVPLSGTLFHTLRDRDFDGRLLDLFRRLRSSHRRRNVPCHPMLVDPGPCLAEQRLIKDREELQSLRRAAEATVAGHGEAMKAARAGMFEYEVQAELESGFRRAGSPRNGYPSIVASGPNACVLHYHENDRKLRRGDLLLIDAGAEVEGVTADVTRTFPVDGRFSEAQRQVYEVVLAAQKAGIRACRAGNGWDSAHRACIRWLTRGLVELGVLRGDVDRLVEKQAVRRFYMHGTSHWLGRDVHDVGGYVDDEGAAVRLRPGMVLTVEPGLYFGSRDRSVAKELRGLGVRIEDDVLVTESAPEVLTAAVPKTVREIERWMA